MTDHPRITVPRLGDADTVLLALDFDGTLAPLVDNPDDARMTPSVRSALTRLSGDPGVTIALVSGRGATNLIQVSFPEPSWWVVGSHGVEVVEPGTSPESGLSRELLSNRQKLWEEFEQVAHSVPGVWVEKKTWGAAIHTRGVDKTVEERVHQSLRQVIDRWGDILTTRTGHGILESSLATATKGDGIRLIRTRVAPQVTVFIGDDVTDEDGFLALLPGDVGIKVGPGETAAEFRVDAHSDVVEFLTSLADARSV